MTNIKFIDLFCGIGGFHHAIEAASKRLNLDSECVFASDIDERCQKSYAKNFNITPHGDITAFDENQIPSHDILLAGFPCQAFSIIGEMQGFADTRGTLFFDVARILKAKQPKFFVLENVKQLVGHDKGRTLSTILKTCKDIGYDVQYKVQHGERALVAQARIEAEQRRLEGLDVLKALRGRELRVERAKVAAVHSRDREDGKGDAGRATAASARGAHALTGP